MYRKYFYSGVFHGGMNAILGPTGSGKTTLLDVLAGRKDPKRVRGTVFLDGQSKPTNFQRISGYVVQVCVLKRKPQHKSASMASQIKVYPFRAKICNVQQTEDIAKCTLVTRVNL